MPFSLHWDNETVIVKKILAHELIRYGREEQRQTITGFLDNVTYSCIFMVRYIPIEILS